MLEWTRSQERCRRRYRNRYFLRDLRVAFGSCRKFHGEAEDCTTALFKQKYEGKKNASKTPNALFLLGDQIYADDVSGLLIEHFNFTGKVLLGDEDGLPVTSGLLYPSSVLNVGPHPIKEYNSLQLH